MFFALRRIKVAGTAKRMMITRVGKTAAFE
jgi:hypothetical protein